ncbi:MAG: SDR family oxidoreductase [Deltaproteobacteria bacterium]|nr:SDR family oxidoreductase [Deltaproteobacteria bacterium]
MPIAMVTGAGIRVGRAIALALADAGYDLILHAHKSQNEVKAVADDILKLNRQVTLVSADLSCASQVDALAAEVIKQHQVIDVLVNSAGAYTKVPFTQLSRAEYSQMMAINLEAPLFLIQSLLPLLNAAKAPCVINITDAAVNKPYAGYTHYMISKAALQMLTKTLALELAPHIRVNAIAPGTIAFPDNFANDKRQRIVAHIPLARTGQVEDIGNAVVYLARDANFITGHSLCIDGGNSLSAVG